VASDGEIYSDRTKRHLGFSKVWCKLRYDHWCAVDISVKTH
jgi:hypothetical protein